MSVQRGSTHWFALLALVIATLVLAISIIALPVALSAQSLELLTISSRPEMVTGNDVLIDAHIPSRDAGKHPTITLNGNDVTSAFHPTDSGVLRGLVSGLTPGRNVIEIKVQKQSAQIAVINHPNTGPVFSGPHQKPFACQTEDNKLGPALDADCSAKTVVTYMYRSTDPIPPNSIPIVLPGKLPPGFKAYDPAAPPKDLAKTTTSQGKTVNYIVRVEKGTINRAVYEIAFLHEPDQPLPTPWKSAPGWNGRIIYNFGGDCKAGYRQGVMLTAVSDMKESQGYATATSSLNIFGNNCDDVISAETMMMVKEHFIKQFGVPVHTIGEGGSGGSMQQHLIAQNYPGLLDGIMPGASFSDITSVALPVADCSLLEQAFLAAKQPWNDDQKKAVSGYFTWGTCEHWMQGYAYDPTQKNHPDGHGFAQSTPCDKKVPEDQVYDPIKNPHGVRCSVYDNEVNVYGRDAKTGFPRRPLDNVGVQYGLAAFNAGKITAEQFIELNEKAGGYDNDGRLITNRAVADPEAVRIAYASGRVNTAGGDLGNIPIVDIRPYMDSVPDIHDQLRSFATRARLKSAHGNADNQVLLTVPGPKDPMPMGLIKLLDPASIYSVQSKEALRLIDVWLDRIDADQSPGSRAVKVARNKPAELTDACFTDAGEKIAEPRSYGKPGRCNDLYPASADPRIVSGGPVAGDVLKCQLKPVGSNDYTQPLNASDLARLTTIFPQGVCDYSKPGIGQQDPPKPWQSY
jgi:hypothetical protein